MSASNITDALIDSVVSQIGDNVVSYFADMNSQGFALTMPKVVKKGLPKINWDSPSVYAFPDETERVDKFVYRVRVTVLYLIRGNTVDQIAKRAARGADALGQLLMDKFSVRSLSYSFGYGVPDGKQEAAVEINADIITS